MRSILRTGQKGFTLIEVMVSLVILATGILMLSSLQTIAITGNKSSSGMSVASTLGQQALEQLLTYNAATDPSLTGCTPPCTPTKHDKNTEILNGRPNLIPDQIINGVTYSRTYTILTNTPITGIRTITLNVAWSVTGSGSHTVTMVERTTP